MRAELGRPTFCRTEWFSRRRAQVTKTESDELQLELFSHIFFTNTNETYPTATPADARSFRWYLPDCLLTVHTLLQMRAFGTSLYRGLQTQSCSGASAWSYLVRFGFVSHNAPSVHTAWTMQQVVTASVTSMKFSTTCSHNSTQQPGSGSSNGAFHFGKINYSNSVTTRTFR